MKKINWLQLAAIVLCLLVFFGYRAVEGILDDSKAPEITFDGQELQISVEDPKESLLRGVSARDNVDGDVTDSLVVESVKLLNKDGTITVTYAAFDKAGNVTKASREARYLDYQSPRFILDSPLIFTSSGVDVLNIIGAEDTFDGDIQHRIRATALDEMSGAESGVYDIRFRVTNSLGDTVELVLPVEVYTPDAYEAELSLTEYLVYLPAGASFSASSYLKEFTQGRDNVSLRMGLPSGYSLQTEGTVDTGTPGVYPVSYKVTYTLTNENNPANSQTYTGHSRLIVVVEG